MRLLEEIINNAYKFKIGLIILILVDFVGYNLLNTLDILYTVKNNNYTAQLITFIIKTIFETGFSIIGIFFIHYKKIMPLIFMCIL